MTTRELPTHVDRAEAAVDHLVHLAVARLVVVDLDGTLLDDQGAVWSENFPRLLRSLTHYGVRVTIATGRTLAGVEPLLTQLRIPRTLPIVLYNGSVAFDVRAGKTLRCAAVPAEQIPDILRIARQRFARVLGYSWNNQDGVQVQARERVVGWSDPENRCALDPNGSRIEWQDWTMSLASDHILAAVLVDCERDPHLAADIASALSKATQMNVTASGSRFVEVRPPSSDKWRGIEAIMRHAGVTAAEVIAIGDQVNDIEMLREAGIGIAVANAPASVVAAARYRTKHSRAQGVLEVLNALRSAKRLAGGLALVKGIQ